VVLDAGHGGFDQGAVSILGNEKDFALDVVERARDLLTKAGFSVRLTRSADVFVPLEDRAAFTNRQSNAVFVSVHLNAGAPDAGGVETYSLPPRWVPSTNNANVRHSVYLPERDFHPNWPLGRSLSFNSQRLPTFTSIEIA
jgi:N-acetylmuramoyl-L-alanine amidase